MRRIFLEPRSIKTILCRTVAVQYPFDANAPVFAWARFQGEAVRVFQRFARDAVERDAVRVVGSESVRWPLVHADDLAVLYTLAVERAPARSTWIGVANDGLPVGRIARAFARRFGTPNQDPQIMSPDAAAAEWGEWARGYALDQRLSGAKAQRELGWRPVHVDVESEIAASG